MRRRSTWLLLLGLASLTAWAVWWLTDEPLTYAATAPATVAGRPEPAPAPVLPNGLSEGAEPDELPLALPLAERPSRPTERRSTPAFEHTENYLLVGVDRTRGRLFGRADTLLVAVFDEDSGHVGAISIPRDLYVDVPDHGLARINASLRIATRTGGDPLEVVRRVVSDTLAMPIHHVVVGDLSVFERTVDAVGGVTVDVPCPIRDDFIDDRTPSGRRLLDVEAGRRHLDGVTAALYVRSRHGRSDWSRARRQQAVLLGLRDRIAALPPTRWLPLLQTAVEEGVTTTMSRLEMLGLARRIAGVEASRLHGIVLGHREATAYRTAEGRAVLLPELDAIDTALAGLFDAPAPGVRPERAECPEADVAVR